MAEHDGEFATTIGQDASFSGKLQFEKGARLLGAFEGEISTKGQLVIAGSGRLSGEASAGNIRVEGQVNGNLSASGKIHLTESARLEGDIAAAKLEVAEGAVLVGRCAIGAKPDERAAAGSVVKTASAGVDKVKPMRSEAPAPSAGGVAPAAIGR
ncbi:MAG TPA: polymer-forming cytoskeletal protein [Phycisphaerae bacterium]|nr:polymer-forming cytoskeletal protein [Phycisphaerae bacterium]